MKEKAVDGYIADEQSKAKKKQRSQGEPLFKPWWTGLKAEKIIDNMPIMTHAKGMSKRVQLPVHESTEVIATMILEKHPEKFKITLDVYKSMLYAGRQLFEFMFLENGGVVNNSKMQKLAKYLHEYERLTFWENWLEDHLDKLAEHFMNCNVHVFSGNDYEGYQMQIRQKVEKVKELVPEQLHKRCDIFLEEEINSEAIRERVKERLRKRDYRERKKNLQLVSNG